MKGSREKGRCGQDPSTIYALLQPKEAEQRARGGAQDRSCYDPRRLLQGRSDGQGQERTGRSASIVPPTEKTRLLHSTGGHSPVEARVVLRPSNERTNERMDGSDKGKEVRLPLPLLVR